MKERFAVRPKNNASKDDTSKNKAASIGNGRNQILFGF
jgi:hypothetical protein